MTDPLRADKDHSISTSEAAAMTGRHRTQSTTTLSAAGAATFEEGSLGGVFTKRAVLALLNQANAEYLRYYHARDGQGKRAIILVACDAGGNDLVQNGATILDRSWSCPPMCPTTPSVLRG